MRLRHGDPLRWNLWESHMTDTDFDLDDEPVLAAESEVAAAICSHQVVMQRGDALTADMLDEFHGFIQEELAALLEEKNAEIAYLRAIANGKFADAAQMRLHHAGLEEDKTFVFIAAHLAAQFKAIGATNYIQIEVNPEELGPLTLTIQRQRGRRRYLRWFLDKLYLLPDYQNQGLGSYLLQRLIDDAKSAQVVCESRTSFL